MLGCVLIYDVGFQGVLILHDMYRATLQYSIPKESTGRQSKTTQDWFCVMCGAHNFKRRDSCFKCCSPRHESESGEDGIDEVCTYPTNTILIRGLDILTTEENVLNSIQDVGSDLPIRSVRIGRDPLTNTSRGVCYVELNSVLDSMQLYNNLIADPPVIDDKQASVSYCKLNQPGSSNDTNGSSSSNSTWNNDQYQQPAEYTAGADIEQLAEYSASLYAKTPEEHQSYVQYYTAYYQQQAQNQSGTGTQSDSVNAAAAVAQSALQAIQQKSNTNSTAAFSSTSTVTTTTTSTTSNQTTIAYVDPNGVEYAQYPTPDVNTYQYDETSGYYYDSSTGLYYDANSTYYYNASSGQYLYWDAEKSTYLPAPTGDGSDMGTGDKKDKERDKQDKVKVAKKIAKDMERWAKAQNKRNDSTGKCFAPEPAGTIPIGEGTAGSGAADAAFAVLLERKDRASLQEKQNQVFQMHMKKDAPPMLSLPKKSSLVAAYGEENSDSEEEKMSAPPVEEKINEDKLVDLSKNACLLCKRQLQNRDALNRHVQLSDLHRNNLEALKKKKAAEIAGGGGPVGNYRDRAKERREKYGQGKEPPSNKLKERYIAAREEAVSTTYEEPTKQGIGNDNIGNKLLKKMGWTDGQGLGKTNQGRTQIIEAERRVSTAGLGHGGSSYGVVGDTYQDCVKKMMYHRYKELDQRERTDT